MADEKFDQAPPTNNRRDFLKTGAAALAGAAVLRELASAQSDAPKSGDSVPAFELDEITVVALQQGLASGRYTSRQLVEMYATRIEAIDRRGPALNSIIEMNPDALVIAEQTDAERKVKGARGPLHGIPVVIKDNIATADKMQTTAGSLALVGSKPPHDSAVAARLRAAEAVILGKTNPTEWANWRAAHSTGGCTKEDAAAEME